MGDIERDLEYELHRILDPITAGPVPARRLQPSGGSMKKLLGGAGAALGVKIVTGFAVAAMAATAAAAATEVAMTGSVNPANWGQQVKTQVDECKASAARTRVHGIGQCVSQFAKQHGETTEDSAGSPSAAPGNANGHSTGNGHGDGNGHGNGHGNNTSHGNGNGARGTAKPAKPKP